MTTRRTIGLGLLGLAGFVLASVLIALANTLVGALIPTQKPDPPGQLVESIEDKAKREAAEQKAKDAAEAKKQESTPPAPTPESSSAPDEAQSQPSNVSSGEGAYYPPVPPPPRAPVSGPGNLGYEPPRYYPSGGTGPGNMN